MSKPFIPVDLDRQRRMRLDYNAIADIEERAKIGIIALLSEERLGFNTIRLIMWAGLKWEDKGLTISGMGDIIHDYLVNGGNLQYLSEIINKAIQESKLFTMGNPEAGAKTSA